MTKIQKLIEEAGGSAAFARLCGIPLRTVENWKAGTRRPSPWEVRIIEDWIKTKQESHNSGSL